MPKIKWPLIGGVAGFILVLLINIIRGNSFLIIFSRSFIYGALTFGVLFGISYYFTQVLGVEFDALNKKEEKENESVDIVVGDDNENEIDDEIEEVSIKGDVETVSEKGENEEIEEDNYDVSQNVEEGDYEKEKIAVEEPKSKESDYEKPEESEEPADLEDRDQKEDVFDDELKEEKIEDDDFESKDSENNMDNELDKVERMGSPTGDATGSPTSSELDDIDASAEDFSHLNDMETDNEEENLKEEDSDGHKQKSLKDSIGVDVSFEEVAKAIRTKLRED